MSFEDFCNLCVKREAEKDPMADAGDIFEVILADDSLSVLFNISSRRYWMRKVEDSSMQMT